MTYLAILQCPRHPTFYALAIEDEDLGTRLTPSKCCGRWETVHRWPLHTLDLAPLRAAGRRARRAAAGLTTKGVAP